MTKTLQTPCSKKTETMYAVWSVSSCNWPRLGELIFHLPTGFSPRVREVKDEYYQTVILKSSILASVPIYLPFFLSPMLIIKAHRHCTGKRFPSCPHLRSPQNPSPPLYSRPPRVTQTSPRYLQRSLADLRLYTPLSRH